jgi:hypothetical protein
LEEIARNLFDTVSFSSFQSYQLPIQKTKLKERLRAENNLLILDNLKSLTGANPATQLVWQLEERVALHDFLVKLFGGKTFILLGSRRNEEWLSDGTFENNVYELSGLDAAAASALANRILKEQQNDRYRDDKDFHKLLKLLKGFPLAIEVVLANLSHQTPTQILTGLQAGDINFDRDDAQESTNNILRCIDYSHSYLTSELQQLLLCLAPFISRAKQNTLIWYPNYLLQQPALANLPFDQWSKVKTEAENYGLLLPDPEIPNVICVQPILSYLLRCSLEEPKQIKKKEAIEKAFCQLYEWVSMHAYLLLTSQSPTERQEGQRMISLEFENLNFSFHLALKAQIAAPYLLKVLSTYLDTTKDEQRSLKLGQMVLKSLQEYPIERLAGSADLERIHIIGTLANQQKILGQYAEAENSYQQLLEFISQVKDIDEEERNSLQAISNHSLGNLTFDQGRWDSAEYYYQRALSIKIGMDNPSSLALTYEQLSKVAQKQGKLAEAEKYSRKAQQVFTSHYSQRPNLLSQTSIYPTQLTISQIFPLERQSDAILELEIKTKAYQQLDTLSSEEIEAMLLRILENRANASSGHDIAKNTD